MTGMEAVQVPEGIKELICSLNIYGVEYYHDKNNRIINITGKMDYMNHLKGNISVSVRQKDLIIEYTEYGNETTISVFLDNKETGTQVLMNMFKIKGKLHIWFKSGYLNIKY